MNTINLYLSVKLTSQSVDCQLISLGVISDCNKSFYAEFTDFDINKCDDWVKENVLSKLPVCTGLYCKYTPPVIGDNFDDHVVANTNAVKLNLKAWLSQFSDYQIQFVIDNDYWGWCKFLELFPIPKLPEKPFPQLDLNQLIAFKKGVTPMEAIKYNRLSMSGEKGIWLVPDFCVPDEMTSEEFLKELQKNNGAVIYKVKKGFEDCNPKCITPHSDENNALWDAGLIKKVYNQLMIEK